MQETNRNALAFDETQSLDPSVLLRIHRSDFHPSLQRVADYIMANRQLAIKQPIAELSQAAGVGKASVVRLCQSLGYAGFRDFRLALAQEVTKQEAEDASDRTIRRCDTLPFVFDQARRSLTESLQTLDPNAFAAAVDILASAIHIVWYGTGASGSLAQTFDHRFALAGFNSRALMEPALMESQVKVLSSKDVVVCVSHSGSTASVVQPMQKVAAAGIPVVSMLSQAESPIAALSQVVLLTVDREYRVGDARITWRPGHEVLFNALLLEMVRRTKSEELHEPW